MAYEDILKKYSSKPTTLPSPPPTKGFTPSTYDLPSEPSSPQPLKIREIGGLEGNRYKDAAEGYLARSRQRAFDEGSANIQKEIDKDLNSSLWERKGDIVKRIPRSIWELFSKPKETALGVYTGAVDAGPRIANGMADLGMGILKVLHLDDVKGLTKPEPTKLPLPGQMFSEYIGYGDSDVVKATSEATVMVAAYAAGQKVVGGTGAVGSGGRILQTVGGDVVGGQLITEGSLKERGKQAAFDAVFGLAEFGVGKGVRAFKAHGAKKVLFTSSLEDGVQQMVDQLESAPRGRTPNVLSAAEKLRAFKETTDFSKIKSFDDFAVKMKEALGDSMNDKVVAGDYEIFSNWPVQHYRWGLEAIPGTKIPDLPSFKNGQRVSGKAVDVDADDIDLGEVIETRDGPVPPVKSSDLTDPEQLAILDKRGDTAKTKIIAKKDLGTDASGQKVMAKTEVDSKTGNAVIYYDKSLDANPELKSIVMDFEEGHILDKRLTGNNGNFSPMLLNPTDNMAALEPMLQGLSSQLGRSLIDVVDDLVTEIKAISGSPKKVFPEQFADAVGFFRQKPAAIRTQAPTFSAFMDYVPNTRFSTKVTTPKSFEKQTGGKITIDPPSLVKRAQAFEVAGEQPPNYEVSSAKKVKAFVAKNADKGGTFYFKTAKDIEMRGTPVKQGEKLGFKNEKGKFVNLTDVKKVDQTPRKALAERGPRGGRPKTNPRIAKTGLDTGKRVEGRSSFNPDKINAPADVERLFNKMDAQNENFSGQRISKNNEDIKDLARMVGMEPDEFLKVKPGSIANAETVTAARQLVLDKARDLADFLKTVDTATATKAQLKEVKDKFVELVAMQKTVAGFRTEASNVFRSFGIELMPGENIALNELLTNLKKMGVETDNDAALFAGKIAKDFQLTKLQRVGQGYLETWYAAILSGPATHVRNFSGNISYVLTELAAKGFDPRAWKEFMPAAKALMRGWRMGLTDAKAVVTGKAVSSGKFFDQQLLRPQTFTGKWATFGRVVEMVGRTLNAADVLFARGAREMEKASLQVYKPDISDAVVDAISQHYAQTAVYRGNPKGRILGGLVEGAELARRKAPELSIIVPFVRVVGNVLDRQFDYMPVFSALRLKKSVLARQVDDIAREAGLTDPLSKKIIMQRLRDQQIGRMAMGTAVTMTAVGLAMAGRISGNGPSNYNEKLQLQRTGWRPNSMKIGNIWVPYTYLGPLAGIFSMAGNLHDKTKYDKADNKTLTDLIGKGFVGWGQTQMDQSFFSGAADLIEVLNSNGTKDAGEYLTKLGTNLVPIPNLWTQSKDMTRVTLSHLFDDPTMRQQYETHGIVDKIRTKLGLTGDVFGMADPLNPRIDAFGDPMTIDFIYGITPSVDKGNAAKVENLLISKGLVVTVPQEGRQYRDSNDKLRKMTEDEYTEYVKKSGSRIFETLHEDYDYLRELPPDELEAEVKRIVDSIREETRLEIFYD